MRAQRRVQHVRELVEMGKHHEAAASGAELVRDLDELSRSPEVVPAEALAAIQFHDLDVWREALVAVTGHDFGPFARGATERTWLARRWLRHVEGGASYPSRQEWHLAGCEQAIGQLSAADCALRESALRRLFRLRGTTDGYDPLAPRSEREEAAARWKAWWEGSRPRLRWDTTWRELAFGEPLRPEGFLAPPYRLPRCAGEGARESP